MPDRDANAQQALSHRGHVQVPSVGSGEQREQGSLPSHWQAFGNHLRGATPERPVLQVITNGGFGVFSSFRIFFALLTDFNETVFMRLVNGHWRKMLSERTLLVIFKDFLVHYTIWKVVYQVWSLIFDNLQINHKIENCAYELYPEQVRGHIS